MNTPTYKEYALKRLLEDRMEEAKCSTKDISSKAIDTAFYNGCYHTSGLSSLIKDNKK